MARNTNQRSINDYVGGLNPGPAPSNEIIDSAVYDQNVAATGDIVVARPQKAIKTANDIVFASPRHDAARGVTGGSSPEPFGAAGGVEPGARGDTRASNVVGDLVTGMPQDDYPREEHLLSMLGGPAILTAGADNNSAVQSVVDVALEDFGPPPHGQLKIDSLNRQSGIGER